MPVLGRRSKTFGPRQIGLNIFGEFHIGGSIKGYRRMHAVVMKLIVNIARPIENNAVEIRMGARAHRHAGHGLRRRLQDDRKREDDRRG